MDRATRRSVLVGGAALLPSLAGCTGESNEPTEGGTAGTDGSGTQGSTESGSDGTGELDLREANVTDVAIESVGGGEFRFDVTLLHDDDGEAGYANWWQVEGLDGARLGRRDLLHAHGTREFTRSETITVPEDADCVVVRGHDQTHGYGGQAMTVAVPGGESRAVRQSSERRSVGVDDCP